MVVSFFRFVIFFNAMLSLILVAVLLFCKHVQAFFSVDGDIVSSYRLNETVPLVVNKITSTKTQLPFAYGELPFACPSFDNIRKQQRSLMNLGHILQGDRYMKSKIELILGYSSYCNQLCTVELTEKDTALAKELISLDYRVEWLVDGLRGLSQDHSNTRHGKWLPQFKMGYVDKLTGKHFLYNHFNLHLRYQTHLTDTNTKYIVGFEVHPSAINNGNMCTFSQNSTATELEAAAFIRYTYSVSWEESKTITWNTRLNQYQQHKHPRIYLISICNTLLCTLLFIGISGMLLMRTLSRDISIYNRESKGELNDGINQGWKLMHGDVFRPPRHSTWMGPLLGSGMQFLNMSMFTLTVGLLGLLSPSYRGGFISYAIALYLLSGLFTGYTSNLIHHVLKEDRKSWIQNAFEAAFLVPSIIFALVFTINSFVWSKGSSAAIPLSTFITLIFLWFGISVPLVYLGAHLSQKKQTQKGEFEPPVKCNPIPRHIPDQPWYFEPIFRCAVGGLVSFIVLYLNMYYVTLSQWSSKYHYMFGFLIVISIILTITAAIVSIGITYCSICCQDYQWWWNSFRIAFVSSICLFIYSAYYFTFHTNVVGLVPAVVYFGHSLILCLIYGLCTGTVGFFATYGFMRNIYTSIKID
ncbi:hypothetical protein PS15m_010474 [Mucor circinelloides]